MVVLFEAGAASVGASDAAVTIRFCFVATCAGGGTFAAGHMT